MTYLFQPLAPAFLIALRRPKYLQPHHMARLRSRRAALVAF